MKNSYANPQAKKAAVCSMPNSMPVSKKFYSRIRERVISVLGALGIAPALTDEYCADVMRLIDRHLAGEMVTVSPAACRHGESMVIFLTLRAEIDMAVERSRRAREAAARRRGAAQPEATPATEIPATEIPAIEIPEVVIPEAPPAPCNAMPVMASCPPVAPVVNPSWRRAGRPNLKKRLKTLYRPR